MTQYSAHVNGFNHHLLTMSESVGRDRYTEAVADIEKAVRALQEHHQLDDETRQIGIYLGAAELGFDDEDLCEIYEVDRGQLELDKREGARLYHEVEERRARNIQRQSVAARLVNWLRK